MMHPGPTLASSSTLWARIVAPSEIAVFPLSTQPGPMLTSWPIVTSRSMVVLAGSTSVTPSRWWRAFT